jgi:hypothetical protein
MGAAAVPGAIALGGAGLSAFAEGQAGKASSDYYGYLADSARINAGLAEAEGTAKQYQIGAETADEQRRLTDRINETVGTQKASVVSGVGASSRSAQDIIKDTLNKGNLDEMALRLNADMKSRNADIEAKMATMNYGAQAAGYNIAGRNAINASKVQQFSSLLGGAGSVANSWYMGDLYSGRYGSRGDRSVN